MEAGRTASSSRRRAVVSNLIVTSAVMYKFLPDKLPRVNRDLNFAVDVTADQFLQVNGRFGIPDFALRRNEFF